MDFRFTEEQREFESLARRVADALAVGPSTEPCSVDWELLVATGLMGLLIRADAGGSAATLVEAAILAEQLGRGAAPSAVVGSTLVAAAAIDLVDSSSERDDLRRALAAGQPMSVAVGDDLSWPPHSQGYAWGWHPGCIVLAPHAGGLAPVDVESNRARPTEDLGLLVAPVETDGSGTALAATDGALRFIAATNVIMSCVLVGVMSRALDLAVDHAKQRQQFGVPIGSFQAVKHLCADMFVDLESSRSMAYGAAAIVTTTTDVVAATRAAAMAKAWCGDAGVRVCEGSIQVHGGMGFTWECEVHRYLRSALAARASFMNSDHAVDVVASSRS